MSNPTKARQHQDATIVSEQQWEELTRRVLQRAAPFFSKREQAIVCGFITFGASYVEPVQIEELRNWGGGQPEGPTSGRRDKQLDRVGTEKGRAYWWCRAR